MMDEKRNLVFALSKLSPLPMLLTVVNDDGTLFSCFPPPEGASFYYLTLNDEKEVLIVFSFSQKVNGWYDWHYSLDLGGKEITRISPSYYYQVKPFPADNCMARFDAIDIIDWDGLKPYSFTRMVFHKLRFRLPKVTQGTDIRFFTSVHPECNRCGVLNYYQHKKAMLLSFDKVNVLKELMR